MINIPLTAQPSQVVSITVNGQNCQISVYQKTTGLYFDLSVDGQDIVIARLCKYGVFLIRGIYHGFVGDFRFVDTQGTQDPDYTGINTRYFLVYES